MEKINSPKFRKGRGFDPSKEVGKTISSKTKLYEVKEDYKKLPEKHQNKITGGIKLYNEPVISFTCLLYTSPSPRDGLLSRMPSSA